MAAVDHELVDFYDLTGGLNTVASAIRLRPNEARDCQNVDLAPIGGLTKRSGYSALNTTAVGSNACTGLYMARYSTNGGTNLAILVSGTAIYRMAAALAGTWTDMTGGLTITYNANNIWTFDMLNDIAVCCNGVDAPIHVASGGSTSNPGGLPFTVALFPVQSRGYMWYFAPTVSGTVRYDRGYFSSINDPATVGTNNFVNVGVGQGGDVRGAVDYKSSLYVFKRHGIYQIIYQPTRVNSSGTVFPWAEVANTIVPGVGTMSHRSIVKFTTPITHATPGQELVFFVDQFGMPRIFDGQTTISFASKIGTSRDTSILSIADMDATRAAYAFSINYPSKNRILCFLSNSNSQQDTCWVLDYSTGFAFTRYAFYSAFNVGALFEESDGTFKPYVGDYAGTVYETDTTSNDNSQPINAYYVTGDTFIGSPAMRSKWFFLEVRGTTGSSDQDITVNYYLDGSDSSVRQDSITLADTQTEWGEGPPAMIWGQSSWAKLGLVTKNSEVNLVGKTLRVRLSNRELGETASIEGWTLAGKELGTAQN